MKITGLRWLMIGLIFLATVINYIDRQTLSVVAPRLTVELHMSPVAYSNVLQAFLIAAGASCFRRVASADWSAFIGDLNQHLHLAVMPRDVWA
jgi:hypothetical protein